MIEHEFIIGLINYYIDREGEYLSSLSGMRIDANTVATETYASDKVVSVLESMLEDIENNVGMYD